MAVLQVENLSKSFGALELFSGLTFFVEEGQKVGLIAPNGAGKSTLLRILVGQEPADSGTVLIPKNKRLAYLPQDTDFSSYPDILSACLSGIRPELREAIARYEAAEQSKDPDALMHAMADMDALGGWQVTQELTALLDRLHLTDPERSTEGLSGGEKKRIALASVLLDSPNILILDEPTNHLDPDVTEWLESYLRDTPVTLLMVTHDRYFLDQVCDTIIELDGGELYTYEGNYSLYLEKRQERLDQMAAEQQSLRNIYRRELEWMRSTPQARSSKAKYRKDAFEETQSRLQSAPTVRRPTLESSGDLYIGKKIFEARDLCKSFGSKVVLRDFSYDFARRDRVGIIGPNGAGKTTLIKLIMGLIPPTSGTITVGETVQFGYFSQMPPTFPEDKKVIEVITDRAEHITLGDGHTVSAMQFLTRFLFSPARQQDYVAKLSGGERRRLQLCTVLMDNPNFLVLDEPTNDLDIPTIQVLEEYLTDFGGCLLIVSHDRFFMDRLAEHLFVLKGDGTVEDFPGNYTDFRLRKKSPEPKVTPTTEPKTKAKPRSERARKRSYKEQQEMDALEAELPQLQEQLREVTKQMNSGTADPRDLTRLANEYAALKEEIDEKEMRWLELSEIE